MPALIELENLAKSYGKRVVLSGLSFSIEAGTNHLLTGPSGCGKSTLLRLIAGLEPPDAGTVRIGGNLASVARRISMASHRRGLALVFQDLGLWPNLTAFQNVRLGLAGLSLSRADQRARARAALESCEIAAMAGQFPFQLSAGELQRVSLARAIAPHPKLLLLDEPFTGLDLALKDSLLEQIRRLSREIGTTVLLVSHYPFDAEALCARVAVLEEGCICETGSLQELRRQPASRTLRAWTREIQPLL